MSRIKNHRERDTIIEAALDIECLTDADRHQGVADHCLSQRRVGRRENGGQHRGLPEAQNIEQHSADSRAGDDRQGHPDDEQAQGHIVVAFEETEFDARGIDEKNEDEGEPGQKVGHLTEPVHIVACEVEGE